MKDLERKTHYKMYKSHKGWLVAGITVTSLAVGIFAGPQATQTAKADDGTPTTEAASDANAAENASQVTLSKSDTTESGTQSDPAPAAKSAPVAETTGVADDATQEEPVTENETVNSDPDAVNDPAGKDSGDGTAAGTENVTDNKDDTNSTGDSVKYEQSGATAGDSSVDGQKAAVDAVKSDDPQSGEKDDSSDAVGTETESQSALKDQKTVAKAADVKKAAAEANQSIDDWMPNKTLQQWVLQALNSDRDSTKPNDVSITSVDQITQDDMKYLTSFSSQDYGVTYIDGKTSFSLEGLQYATNLTHLDLINDIDKEPNALRGDITDLSPLSSLTNLTWLQTGQSRVTDITPISNLKKIKYLFIGISHISDFSSLDPTQYTENFAIGEQFVENKVVYVPTTGQYEMVNPIKPPKGMTLSITSPGGIGIPIVPENFPDSEVRVFWQGGTGSLSADQSKIDYTVLKNQIEPGPLYNPYEGIYDKVPQEAFAYWLTSLFEFTGNGVTIPTAVAMVTPYRISIPAEPVTVHYVNEQNQDLIKPTELNGLQMDSFTTTAPIIPGYVLKDSSDTITGEFTNAPQTITFTYKSALVDVTQVSEKIQYQDTKGNQVADPSTQSVTFATITDPTTKQDTVYSKVGPNADMSLDELGKPDASWSVYTDGETIPFNAVANPTIQNMHVVRTTDPANDLTQTTAQNVTNTSTNLSFVVTYGHDFDTAVKQVTEGITYVDQSGKQVADPTTKTITFATVTDQSTGQQTVYSNLADAQAPALDEDGQPTDAGWTVYQAGDQVAFDAVQNPMIKGMHVVKTTDPANDLTQVTEQAITSEAANLAFVVTYAHDFTTDTKQVTEGITYVDESGKQVAEPVTKTITFVTVTDQSNDQQTVYSNPTAAQAPELDENGKPTDAAWTVYQAGDPLTFEAVANPNVAGMHVIKTTDPANDLTQTTAQTVTGDSADLAFVVTYAADTTGGGGNPDPGNPDPETPDPGNPDPENPDPENPDPETPDPGNPGGGGSVTPEVPSTGGNSSGSAGDQGAANKKPNKVTGGQNAGAVNNGGSAATGQPGMTAAVSTGGHAAKVDLAANTAKQPAQATSKDANDQLPQTNEQANNGLAVVGLALLGALAGVFGWKKRQD